VALVVSSAATNPGNRQIGYNVCCRGSPPQCDIGPLLRAGVRGFLTVVACR